jgi:rfaE bifunctional protein nucleotidyltransferase chain/domain
MADHGHFCNIEGKPGQIVVFTNGCFDLLHEGHKHLLRFAKLQGNFLVVAVNSDASVKQLKGDGRPVQNIAERVQALRDIQEVDEVIVFNEDTPLQLIYALRPQVYIKGADYAGKELPEAEFVHSYGGKVVFCPLLEGFSTTSILAHRKQK